MERQLLNQPPVFHATRLLRLGAVLLALTACQSTLQQAPTDPTAPAGQAEAPPPSAARSTAISPGRSPVQQPVVYTDTWHRLRDGLQLQEHYFHPEVEQWLARYANDQRLFDLITERAEPFLFFIVEEIERRGLPLELALLPVVESSFDPNAYSAQHAVGLWQFVGPTARSFGLQLDWWYDGRRDPHMATLAALDYLTRLHQQFDENWLLALAAYNTGAPNLRRAIRRSARGGGAIDFWELPLAPETLAHVPKLLALARIFADPDTHGIALAPIANRPWLTKVAVAGQIDLREAARLAEIDYQELRRLNPGYLQWATHPDHPQSVYVPAAKANIFEQKIASIPSDELLTWDRYQIRPGDTLGAIAQRLGTEVEVLRVINGLTSSQIISGRSLLVPRGLNADSDLGRLASVARQYRNPPASVPVRYTVQRGDNLWTIARRYQLRSSDIMAHNGIAADALLMPGQVLDLSFAASADEPVALAASAATQYRVRPGDTMADIAASLDLRLQELLQWNGFRGDEIIYPDQLIRISPPDPEPQSL